MTSPLDDMYYDGSQNRSPSNAPPRGYSTLGGLNRQQSRHFEPSYSAVQHSVLYGQEDNLSGQYVSRTDRLPTQQYSNTSYNQGPYDWGNTYAANTNAATMGAPRMRQARRTGLPSGWLNDGMSSQLPGMHSSNQYGQMPPQSIGGYANGYPSEPHNQVVAHSGTDSNDEPEDLIPTAIVIKNIPFAVKKEMLQDYMAELNLPIPYAFNYHFDAGVFRGLAFANFSTPEDTAQVISVMNHLELQGRKLRVEYKKMLPAHERERIEREKRERRGQLEEQHRPQTVTHQTSMSSMSSQALPRTSPSPVSTRANQGSLQTNPVLKDVDMNSPKALDYYSQLLKFKDSQDKVLQFKPLPPAERKVLHALSHYLGLHHQALGQGDDRFIQILKEKPPPAPQSQPLSYPPHLFDERRGVTRAATTDFSEARANEMGYYPSLRGQTSEYLGVPRSPGGDSLNRANGLRGAKSFGDLNTRSISPALSVGSNFTPQLAQNANQYNNDYNAMNGGHSTADFVSGASGAGRFNGDAFVQNFGGLTLHDRQLTNRSTGRLAGTGNDNQVSSFSGPIGSQRPINGLNGNQDDPSRNAASAVPERQPRGPGTDWSNGFTRPRQNGHVGRNSDELDQHQLDQASERSGGHSSRQYM